MEPIVRALDVGFGHTKFVSSVDGSEVRCGHFPSVAYPTENDETMDPMGGRRKTVGIPIDATAHAVVFARSPILNPLDIKASRSQNRGARAIYSTVA